MLRSPLTKLCKITWLLLVLMLFAVPASAAFLTFVEVQKGGEGVNGLDGAHWVTVSPDGAHVYAAGGGDDAVAVFSAEQELPIRFSPSVQVDRSPTYASVGALAIDGRGKVYVAYVDQRIDPRDIFFNRSTDSGQTFEATDQQVGGIGSSSWAVYPNIAADSNDHVYAVWEDGRAGCHVYFNRSNDGGATFEGEKRIDNSPEAGYPDVAADDAGHVYVSRHNEWGAYPAEIWVDVSSDYGNSFDLHRKVSDPVGGTISRIATDGAGNVYVVFAASRAFSDVYLNKSSDWGDSWGTPIRLGDLGTGYSYDWWWLVPNVAVEGDHVYVAWPHHVGNDEWDIYLVKSVDRGETFDSPLRVNVSERIPRPKIPSLAVDGNNVYLGWDNGPSGDKGLWLTISTDGGVTFAPPLRIDDGGEAELTYFWGGMVAQGGQVYVTWQDTRTGDWHVRFAYAIAAPTLTVRAFIDGRSHLIVQGNTVHWHHLDYAAPGRHGGANEPTYLNGKAWYPTWPDVPDEENRNCDCDSSLCAGVPTMASLSQTVALDIVQARGSVVVVQQPDESNEYTLIVEFNDSPQSGSDWYEIDLAYLTAPPPPPGWSDICVPQRMEITGLGMGDRYHTINPQTLSLTDPSSVNGLLAQMAGRIHADAPIPNGVTFSTDAPQSITLHAPTSDLIGFTYETELQPTGQITASVSGIGDDYRTPRGLILYSQRATTDAWTSVGKTTNSYVYAGRGEYAHTEVLTFPPLEEATDLYITAVVIDNDDDSRPLVVEATAGGVMESVTELGPTDGDGLNIVNLMLQQVPAGTSQVGVTLRSPQESNGDSLVLVGLNISHPCGQASAIGLVSFTAQAAADYVTLAWETGTEVDNAGFNLWRGEAADSPYTKINETLILAEGDAHSGASYTYTDTDVVKGVTYYYKLEDVDIHGLSTLHGPVSATPSSIRRIYMPLIFK